VTKKPYVVAILASAAVARAAVAADDDGDDLLPVPTLAMTVTASSTLAASKAHSYEPWRPLVGWSRTSGFWCEGKRDEGIGEALVVTLAAPTTIASLSLHAGVWKSMELFQANNIITGVDVVTDDGRVVHVVLPEELREVDVALGGGPVKQLTIKLTKVKKGRMNDSCISGVQLHATPETSLVVGDAASLAALRPSFAKIRQAIADCDAAALRTLAMFPMSYSDTAGAKEDTMRVIKYKDASALIKACKSTRFTAFGNSTHFAVKSESPTRLRLEDETLEWQLALDAGRWKLAGLIDGTP